MKIKKMESGCSTATGARTSPRVARGPRAPRRTTASSSPLRRSFSVSSERAREGESGPCAKKTLANLLSSERHQWRENESGRFVDNVLTQCKDGGGSPFGVELELVRSQDFAASTSASSISPKVRMETDNYHVYYVLAGSGRLGHLKLGRAQAVEIVDVVDLRSGDIFVVAPRVPYQIETTGIAVGSKGGGLTADGQEGSASDEKPMVMVSISVSVNLVAHKDRRRAPNGGAGGDGKSRGDLPVQIKLNHQETESCLLSSRLRRTAELLTFQLPNNTGNRIAPVFDPFRDCTPFTCSIEILEPLGVIPTHKHDHSYELFIVLSGRVDLFLGKEHHRQFAGDTLLVKPLTLHSLVNPDTEEKLYMLSIILPNENFAKEVWNGTYTGLVGAGWWGE